MGAIANKVLSIATFTLVGATAGFYVLDRIRVAQKEATLTTLRADRDRLTAELARRQL